MKKKTEIENQKIAFKTKASKILKFLEVKLTNNG